jgi:hypothetical protein
MVHSLAMFRLDYSERAIKVAHRGRKDEFIPLSDCIDIADA